MATVNATKAGNWSDATVWSTGIVPVAGEDVSLVTYAVAMNVARIPATGTLLSLTATTGNVTFAFDSAAKMAELNATTITGCSSGTLAELIKISGESTGGILTINGNVVGGSATSGRTVSHVGKSTIMINGSISGGSAGNNYGVLLQSTGPLIVNNGTNDAVSPGHAAGTYGLYTVTAAPITIVGHVVANDHAVAFLVQGACAIDITGNVTGGSGSAAFIGLNASEASAITVHGNVTGVTANGIKNAHASGTVHVTGNVTGGDATTGNGIENMSTGVITVDGNVLGATGAGITNTLAAAVTIGGNVTAGSNAAAYGISNGTTGAITVGGNVLGATTSGIKNIGAGAITVTGNVTAGGVSVASVGIDNAGLGTVTISGNLVFSDKAVPVSGKPPIYTPKAGKHITVPYTTGTRDYEYPTHFIGGATKFIGQ